MANSVSISQSIAGRYAQAVFEIAKESGGMDALATQTDDLNAALHDSAELRDLIASPIYSRDQQAAAIGALSTRMGLSPVLANTLQLMAKNRRLFVLPQLTARLAELIATERGEVTADVTSAIALTDAQMDRLARRRAGATLGWYIHAAVYLLVNLGLAALAGSGGRAWHLYPLAGWGLGLAIHGLAVWLGSGADLHQRLLDAEREKLRRQPRH